MGNKKILIIDDEASMGEVLQDFLNQNGYQAAFTTSAMQGLSFVTRENPSLVLLDIVMPEISGLECLKKIKEIRPDTIVIMISGLQNEELAKQAISQGAYDYITKPFDLAYLLDHFVGRIFPST